MNLQTYLFIYPFFLYCFQFMCVILRPTLDPHLPLVFALSAFTLQWSFLKCSLASLFLCSPYNHYSVIEIWLCLLSFPRPAHTLLIAKSCRHISVHTLVSWHWSCMTSSLKNFLGLCTILSYSSTCLCGHCSFSVSSSSASPLNVDVFF